MRKCTRGRGTQQERKKEINRESESARMAIKKEREDKQKGVSGEKK